MNGATSYAEAAFGRAAEGGERVLPENFPVGMRVLLVDDDVTCLAVVKGMLLKCKYEVTTCSQATKALSLLRENKNAFDIILSDVHMPDMDGFRLLELVGLEMDLPVIMMSADTRFNIVMKGIKHGACDFLIKPVRMAELQNLWQHLVRRKCHDNREPEHSGSLDESDRGKQIDDYEYGTATNDGSDGSWRSQKKKRDIKEEEDGELDSTDPSSSKKPRVVWSVELHQQFVNAVNQLGIDKAVPKRILELMNVPGLTRENVASHLQKFRLYLKRLSGVVQHHAGLANSLSGGSANAKVDHLGSLDFQTLAVTGQIPPQTLAVLQDELLGRPRNLSMPANAIDQTILRQASVQGNRSVTVEQGISFGQPLLNGQGVSFPMWSSNNLGSMVSPSNAGSINSSQDTNILATMLQQQQPHPVLESHRAANVQPSCLLSPAQSSQRFHIQTDPIFSNQDCLVSPSQRSNSFNMGNSVIPMNQNSVLLSSQSSTNLQTGNSVILLNKNSTMVPSQSLPNMSGGKNPGYLRQNTSIAPSQPFTNFQTGMTQLPTGPNSLIPSYQSPSTFQSKHNLDHVTHNPSFNDSSSIVDYDQLSSEFNIVGQVLDGDFSNSALVDSYSSLGSISSIDGSSNQQLHSADGSFSHPNASMYVVPHSFNAQNGNIVTEDLSDQNKRRNLGFVGKGTRLPSRFVVDDMEAPSNVLTHGNMYINNDEYLLNQDIFGSNGTLQNGRCASTSFK